MKTARGKSQLMIWADEAASSEVSASVEREILTNEPECGYSPEGYAEDVSAITKREWLQAFYDACAESSPS